MDQRPLLSLSHPTVVRLPRRMVLLEAPSCSADFQKELISMMYPSPRRYIARLSAPMLLGVAVRPSDNLAR